MKILGFILLAPLLAIGAYLWQTEFGDDEIFILSDGYTGVVFILYDQKNGEPEKYDRGKRVYEIPPNGILKTQFSRNTGWHRFGEYYYKQENGTLIRIPYVFQGKDMESNKDIAPNIVHVCCDSAGRGGRSPKDPDVVYGQFFVGTEKQIREAGEKREKINPIDLIN